MASYPQLVPKRLCKTPITVTIYGEGLTESGAPIVLVDEALLYCNYQDGGKAIMTNEQKYVRISGSAYFNGDPFPYIPNITGGEVVIFGEKRKIEQGIKGRNPDGTVNFVQLRLM